jgi:S1-C subfamily serine protease
MSIVCVCSSCEAKFKVDDKHAGKKARCPKCAEVNVVPAAEPAGDDSAQSIELVSADKPTSRVPTKSGAVAKPPAPKAAPPKKSTAVASSGGAPKIDIGDAAASSSGGFAGISNDEQSQSKTSRSRPTRKKKSVSPVVLIGGGIGAVLLLIVLVVAVVILNREPSPAKLVVQWDEADRNDAKLMINNERKELPDSGPLEFELVAGTYKVLIQRRGFEPSEAEYELEAGEEVKFAPTWKQLAGGLTPPAGGVATDGGNIPGGSFRPGSGFKPGGSFASTDGRLGPIATPLPGFNGWYQDFDRATKDAKLERKDVLLVFTSIDSKNQKTDSMINDIYASNVFKTQVLADFVPVVLDFPTTEAGLSKLLDSAANQALMRRFMVSPRDFPVQILVDIAANPYSVQRRDMSSNPQTYATEMKTAKAEKQTRDQLFTASQSGSDDEKIEQASKALKWLGKNKLQQFYPAQVANWLSLAKRVDPNNANGKYEEFFEADWYGKLYKAVTRDPGQLSSIMADLQKWSSQKKFTDPDRAVRMLLNGAQVMFQTGNREGGTKMLEFGLAYSPNDPKLQAALKKARSMVEYSNVLSSGTGFVVAPGYIMTNNHVIDGPGGVVIQIGKTRVPAQIIATDPRVDMAILKVDPTAINQTPLAVSTTGTGRGTKVAAFGYPLTTQVGAGLKQTQGAISGLPDARNEGMLLLDLRINSGNSGGPLCSEMGHVVGMITAKTVPFKEGVDTYGMAVPADKLLPFLQKHIPGYSPKDVSGTAKLGFDEIDRNVSESVLLILKVRES